MGKLADKIRNLAKAAKSRREPVIHDIEIDDEPYVHDIEMEDDELGDIVVMSDEDIENLDDDEFEKFAEESREYGNEKMDKKSNAPKTSSEKRIAGYSPELRNTRENNLREHAGKMNKKAFSVTHHTQKDVNKRENADGESNKLRALQAIIAKAKKDKNAKR